MVCPYFYNNCSLYLDKKILFSLKLLFHRKILSFFLHIYIYIYIPNVRMLFTNLRICGCLQVEVCGPSLRDNLRFPSYSLIIPFFLTNRLNLNTVYEVSYTLHFSVRTISPDIISLTCRNEFFTVLLVTYNPA